MEIAEVLERHSEILFAYLYGSAARGEAGKKSDVDIGIFVREDFEVNAFYEIELAMEIERECGLRGVEVVILNKVLNKKPLRFLNQVLRYGKLIFSRDEKARIAFETYVTKAYIDFLPHYREYDRMRFKA
jgi:hypothetical protein